MTNTTQTSLLDGVEPDSFRDITSMNAKCNHGVAYICGNCTVKRVYFYSRKTVEALLEALRKQVLLEAAEKLNTPLLGNEPAGFAWTRRHILSELRRMVLDDKGEKNEEG
jgi:hypothetical protein